MYDKTPLDLLEYHHSMLADKLRTESFKKAIEQQVKPGDVVLDIGCGSGILTYFACMAGAKRVYAVEQGPMYELAQMLCHKNGFSDRVVFLNGWSTKVTLPEPADVLITETIGNIGFDEGIIGWILDAKKRNLKPNARIVPSKLTLCAVPVQSKKNYEDVARWEPGFYGLDFTPARTVEANNLIWTQIETNYFMSHPARMITVDLTKTTEETFCVEHSFPVTKNGIIHGLGGWFESEIAPGIQISTKPHNQAPSWSHGFLPIERPLHVEKGDTIKVRIQIESNAAQWDWDVTLSYPTSENDSASDERVEQSTLVGDLKTPPLVDTIVPMRSADGEIDLFILQKMDSVQTIAEIARETAVQFPEQLSNYEEALARSQLVSGYYNRGLEHANRIPVDSAENDGG